MARLLGRYRSPLGTILVACDGEAITGLWFWGQKYFAAGIEGPGAQRFTVQQEHGVIETMTVWEMEDGRQDIRRGEQDCIPADGRYAGWEERPAGAPVLAQAAHWLARYFAGGDPGPTPPLAPDGSPFRQAVWAALMEIPYGQTRTYGQLAQALAQRTGKKAAPRAVGGAVGHNPISLMIPCHRVVGAGGALTGYAGGLERKKALLALEKTAPAPPAGP